MTLARIAVVVFLTLTACVPTTQPRPETQPGVRPVTSSEFFEGVPVKSRKTVFVTIQPDTQICAAAFTRIRCIVIEYPNGQREVLTEGIHGYTHIEGQARGAQLDRIEFDTSRPKNLPADISSVQYRMVSKG